MLLVGCGLGWLIRDVREQQAVVRMIVEHGGIVAFDEHSFLGRLAVVRSLFGEHAFSPIIGVVLRGPDTTDAHLLPLKKLKKLKYLSLSGTRVSDLSPLAGLSGLTTLNLERTGVSAEQVEALRTRLPRCKIVP